MKEIKEQICEIGRRLYAKDMIAGGDGNISVRDENGIIWITPAGKRKGELVPEDILGITIEGEVRYGLGTPSTETKMHLAAYRICPHIHAVVHAHPQAATAYTVAGAAFENEVLIESLPILGEVVTAPYGRPSTDEVVTSLAPYLAEHPVILMANHGAVTTGKTLWEAYNRIETLEHVARTCLYGKLLSAAYQYGNKEGLSLQLIERKKQ